MNAYGCPRCGRDALDPAVMPGYRRHCPSCGHYFMAAEMAQIDIFGETQALTTAGMEPPIQRDAVAQSRLFEPQMEGQLALEAQRPATKDGSPLATTTTEGNRHGSQ